MSAIRAKFLIQYCALKFALVIALASVAINIASAQKFLPKKHYAGNLFGAELLPDLAEKLAFASRGYEDRWWGYPGANIVVIGDSLLWGTVSDKAFWTCAVHQFKCRMQQHYNPAGVPGGYGFMRFANYLNGTPMGGVDGPMFSQRGVVDAFSRNAGIGGHTIAITPSPTETGLFYNNMVVKFAGYGESGDANHRTAVTSVDLLYSQGDSGAFSAVSAWTFGTLPPLDPQRDLWLNGHFLNTRTIDQMTNRVRLNGFTPLDPNQSYYLSLGNGIQSGNLFVPGVVSYNGDEQSGLRVMNLANIGRSAVDAVGLGNPIMLRNAVDMWVEDGSYAAWIVCLGQNDVFFGVGDYSPESFFENLRILVNRIRFVTGGNGKVLFVVPPWRTDEPSLWNRARGSGHPLDYYDAYYRLRQEFPQNAILWDMPAFYGSDRATINQNWWQKDLVDKFSASEARGFIDRVHLTTAAQKDIADVLYDIFTNDVTVKPLRAKPSKGENATKD